MHDEAMRQPSAVAALPTQARARALAGALPARLACALFIAAAAYFAATTFCAIANYAWQQPMFDQYRSYEYLLELPFPRNVLQLDNGHRPIFPNLVRVAEIHWFGADQLLQIGLGSLFAYLSAALIAACAWRERALPLVARGAGVMFAVLGVLWLANARMLLHGNEALHAYSIVLALILAALSMWRAKRVGALRWIVAASASCVVATFCFGPGVATFAAVIASGVLLRLPWRWLAIPAATMLGCVFVYVYLLPNDAGVRGMLALHPLDSAQVAAKWIASPWINGWLGMADPPLEATMQAGLHRIAHGDLLIGSANGVQDFSGLSWQAWAALIGAAGIALFLSRVAWAFLRREPLTRTQVVSIALCLFALASAAIIGIGRLENLRAIPSQTYADRYLMWPSLFWAGLALLCAHDIARLRRLALTAPALLFAATLPCVLAVTQEGWAAWGMVVKRMSQQSAAAARSGVFDPAVFPDGPDATRADVEHALALLRARHLAMFAASGWERLGTRWSGKLDTDASVKVQAAIAALLPTADASTVAARFEGQVSDGMRLLRGGQLAVLDGDDTIVGFAAFSHIIGGDSALRLDIPRKRGFDGYIRDYRAGASYRLILWQGDAAPALLLDAAIGAGSAAP